MLVCFVFAITLVMAACAETVGPACAEGSEHFVKYELFMGRNNQSGEVVDDAAWTSLLRDSVTPRFPDGLTVLPVARFRGTSPEGTFQAAAGTGPAR